MLARKLGIFALYCLLAVLTLFCLAALVINYLIGAATHTSSPVKSANRGSVFYRLKAQYQHKDDFVNFDIVVGCNVIVTQYKDSDKSYDAFRSPVEYTQRLKDGSAVLQMVPAACEGYTTENGRVPKDLLPGAIYFPSADDLSLGYGYITERAYEAPNADIKLIGAEISSATQQEWEAFQERAGENLIDPAPYSQGTPPPPAAEAAEHAWDTRYMAKWWPTLGCYGYSRLRFEDAKSVSALAASRPSGNPRFWTVKPASDVVDPLLKDSDVKISGKEASQYFWTYYDQRGFPTKSGGGALDQTNGKYPSDIFPVQADDGLPWLSKDLLTSKRIVRRVDLNRTQSPADLYCYSWSLPNDPNRGILIPGYNQREFETEIDGTALVPAVPGQSKGPEPTTIFFGDDNDVYRLVHVRP